MKMNETTSLIRAYQPEDIDPVMAVWAAANALAHPFLEAAFVMEVERSIREDFLPISETYVLEDKGQVIGFIALIGNQIGGLFLDPTCHRRGYGRALVDHAVALKGPLKVEVFRDNAIGRPFYEGYGFEPIEDEFHAPSGQVNRKMAMPGA